MAEPLVSVLMPVYNGEKYLAEAISSILGQTFTDFEFLIINDGSSDRSEEIILSFNDKRIRYVKNVQNLKIIDTLNKGFDLAKGKYIARMDADDVSYPERLAKQIGFMEANPACGLCGTDIEPNGKADESGWIKTGDNEFLKFSLLFYNPFCHPTAVLRTAVLKEHHLYYDKKYIHVEDYELWTRIALHAEIVNLKDKLLMYRVHGEQVSVKYSELQQKMVEKVKLCVYDSLLSFPYRKQVETHLFLINNCYLDMDVDFSVMLHIFRNTDFFYRKGNRKRLDKWVNSIEKSRPYTRSWNNKYLKSWLGKIKTAATKI